MKKVDLKFNFASLQVSLPDQAGESVLAEIFKEREYKISEAAIAQAKHPILDVGAHVGLFSLYARLLNPNVEILAIEPEEKNFKILKENIKQNKLNRIKAFNVALGGRTEKKSLFISLDSHNHRLESAPESNQKEEALSSQPVQVFSFRDFLDQEKINFISLLKMDIEGGEYDVFSAFMPADFARVGAVVMEYHNYGGMHYKEIETQLRENGFGVQIFPSKFDKSMGFIFAKNKRV